MSIPDIFLKFVDWILKRKERWPLLLLATPFGLFYLTEHFYELSWIGTLTHWFFLRTSGVSCFLSGALYLAFAAKPPGYPLRKLRRPWLFSGVCCALGLALFYLSFPPSLPDDRLVVTIAQFGPVSDDARDEAANLPNRIYQMLLDKKRAGAPLEVKLISESVTGPDEQSKEYVAQSIGESWQGNANVIVWGEVRKDENELRVECHISVARKLREVNIGQSLAEAFTDTEPQHLEFVKRVSDNVADMVTFLYGLAYYKVKQWDRSGQIFNAMGSRQGQLYKGLSLLEKSKESQNPPSDLNAAISALEAVIGPGSSDGVSASMDQLSQAAAMDEALAHAMLATFSQPADAVALLKSAIQTFHAAIPVVTQEGRLEVANCLQINLNIASGQLADAIGNGAVQGLLGQKTGEEQGTGHRLLDPETVLHWKEAAERCRSLSGPEQTVDTEMSCGDAFQAVAASLGGHPGDSDTAARRKLLQESITARQAALAELRKEDFPQKWATLQNNLGLVFLAKGAQVPGPDPEKNARKAEDSFRTAQGVWTRTACPICWALAENNLGKAVSLQGIQSPRDEQRRLIRESIDHWLAAQGICSATNFPASWTEIQIQIVGSRSWLSGIVGTEAGRELLDQASKDFDNLVRVWYDSQLTPNYDVSYFLKQALFALRSSSGDPNGMLLEEAINVEGARLHYWKLTQPLPTAAEYDLEYGAAMYGLHLMANDSDAKSALLRRAIKFDKRALSGVAQLKPSERFDALEGIIDAQIRLAALLPLTKGRALLFDSVSRSRRLISSANGVGQQADGHYSLGVSLFDLAVTLSGKDKTKRLQEAILNFNTALDLLKNSGESGERETIDSARAKALEFLAETQKGKI